LYKDEDDFLIFLSENVEKKCHENSFESKRCLLEEKKISQRAKKFFLNRVEIKKIVSGFRIWDFGNLDHFPD